MESNFDRAFNLLQTIEGGYVNHPNDPGGETNYGITEALARAHGYTGDMKLLPLGTAKSIYKSNYWLKEFDSMPFAVAYCIFDACVNHGVRRAVLMAQHVVSAKEDGILGSNTLALIISTPPDKFIREYCSERLHFMTAISSWPSFGRGWTRRVAKMLSL